MKLFIDSKGITIDSDLFISKLKPFINPKDYIYIEIDIMSFGKLYDLTLSKEEILEAINQIFRNLVGELGHICVPSFSYSWGKENSEKVFDIKKSIGQVGVFPEFIRKKNNTHRTKDPMFSVLINGPKSEEFCTIDNSSFGHNSIFQKLHKENAKLITFGLKQYDPTFVHYIEEFFDNNYRTLKYRKVKKFKGFFIENNQKIEGEHFVFARDLNSKLKFDHKNLFNDLKQKKVLDSVKIGSGYIHISDCNSVFETAIAGLHKDSHYLVS